VCVWGGGGHSSGLNGGIKKGACVCRHLGVLQGAEGCRGAVEGGGHAVPVHDTGGAVGLQVLHGGRLCRHTGETGWGGE
jgi:hypothetical protein